MQLVHRVGTLSKINNLRQGWQNWLLYGCLAFVLTSCAASKGYYPESKIPPKVLKQDFQFFRNVLEESHPSLYWFETKDSLDKYFNQVQTGLTDSLTEREFRTRLNYILSKIRCGHTVSIYSKRYSNFLDTANLPLFPIHVKCWKDTLVVTSTLSRKSSPLTRGTVIRAINGIPASKLIDTFFNYINGDGFSDQGRYQYLSNRGNFGTLYKNVLGLSPYFRFEYVDSTGLTQYTTLPVFEPSEDSTQEIQLCLRVISQTNHSKLLTPCTPSAGVVNTVLISSGSQCTG